MLRRHTKLFLTIPLFFLLLDALAQPGSGYNKDYTLLHSGNLIADKNFYLLTVIDRTPAVAGLLSGEATLRADHDRRQWQAPRQDPCGDGAASRRHRLARRRGAAHGA